jgi:hypothetical protein
VTDTSCKWCGVRQDLGDGGFPTAEDELRHRR